MTLQSTFKSHRRYAKWTALVDHIPGEVVRSPSLRAGIIQGINPNELKTGQEVTIDTEAVADVASASGTTFALGATVGWDDTANLAVAGGAGDFDIGKAEIAKTAGQLVVRVAFNA